LKLFSGNNDCCGVTTYSGTESILHAVFAYSNIAKKNGINIPEVYFLFIINTVLSQNPPVQIIKKQKKC